MLEDLRRRLLPAGLNLAGVAAVRDYDALVAEPLRIAPRWPAGRAAVVIGNGGRAFWEAARATPGEHPLDRFAEERVEEAARAVDGVGAILYPHRFAAEPVSFLDLALCAGLGSRSLLGILIRPDYGTWFGLRAAILVEADVAPSPPLSFDPCPSCAKPCIGACPAGAVSAGSGWNIPVCAAHRLRGDDCAAGCHSRIACIYGREHAYDEREQRHHQGYALAAMRRHAAGAS